ncbi:MAG TPA: glycosyltransferase [Rhodanobacteraceae bacterium]|nr:glycosyltransferase [Rhodanobacteraceae bacterium]
MRIAHVITGLGPGGAQAALLRLVQTLGAPDFEHVVIALGDEGPLSAPLAAAAEVRHLHMRPGRLWPQDVVRLRALLHAGRFEVIQAWMYHANLMAVMAGWRARAPLVWNIRHSLATLANEKRSTRWVIRAGARLSRRPSRIIFNAAVSRAQHLALGYAGTRAVVIPNGFDTDAFAPAPAPRARVRAELGLAPEALAIGLVARVHPMKDHANFLAAAECFATTHPDAVFVLAGQGADADNAALGAEIDRHHLRARIRLCGRRADIAAIDNALDVAVSASAWGEAFPNATAEAMACGVPCVVTAVGDAPTIVADTGVVVPPRDSAALCAAWSRLAATGAAGRRALGARARQRVIDHYGLASGARRYAELYTQVTRTPCTDP